MDYLKPAIGAEVALGTTIGVIIESDPRSAVFELFSAFRAPHPEGFSGYFDPSTDGWSETRIDHCHVSVFLLPDRRHLIIVNWTTDEPGEFTQRHIRQMSRSLEHAFPGLSTVPRTELRKLIPASSVVAPEELGLDEQNAGAQRQVGS
jgi:hypothetical protein